MSLWNAQGHIGLSPGFCILFIPLSFTSTYLFLRRFYLSATLKAFKIVNHMPFLYCPWYDQGKFPEIYNVVA